MLLRGEKYLARIGNETRFLGHSFYSLVIVPTMLSHLADVIVTVQ
jgi:hypothetical protein